MIINCKYFKLIEKKDMQDGNFIPAYQKMLYICTEDNLMQFETVDDSDIKKIFWANEKEVVFIEETQEVWTEERLQQQQNEINGNFLNI